jgi:hypothetical protein
MIDELDKKQKHANRAEVVIRAFMIKLKQLLRDISQGIFFVKSLQVSHYKLSKFCFIPTNT